MASHFKLRHDQVCHACQLSPKMGRHHFYFVNERFRRVHAMGDVRRRADFVGGRR